MSGSNVRRSKVSWIWESGAGKEKKEELGESGEKVMTGFCWSKELMSRRGRSQGDRRWDAENGWLLGVQE